MQIFHLKVPFICKTYGNCAVSTWLLDISPLSYPVLYLHLSITVIIFQCQILDGNVQLHLHINEFSRSRRSISRSCKKKKHPSAVSLIFISIKKFWYVTENTTFYSSISACILLASETCLLSRCLAMAASSGSTVDRRNVQVTKWSHKATLIFSRKGK
jgi:hypothetical protein